MRIHFLSDGESRWESNPPKQAAAYTGFEDQRAHQSPFCSHMENPRPAVLIIILFSIKVNTHFKGKRICILFLFQGSDQPGTKDFSSVPAVGRWYGFSGWLPDQDPLVADHFGDLLRVKVIQEKQREFSGHTEFGAVFR